MARGGGEFNWSSRREFEKLYGRGWRQIYRWVERGRKVGRPCPLKEPKKMPLWWAQCNSQACPESILSAARNAGGADSAPQDDKKSVPPGEPMDFDSVDLSKADPVEFQRRLVGSQQERMRRKALAGENIDLEQSQYLKAVRTLRELERDDREAKAHRGKFIPRDIVERDDLQAADMLRQMHPVMQRRVIERCPDLPPKQRADVLAALGHVFAAQARVFQRLTSFSAPDDFLSELAAA